MPTPASLTFTAVAPGPSLVTVTINGPSLIGPPNAPLSITVSGNAIVIQWATDGAGHAIQTLPTNSGTALAALYAATPAALALATLSITNPTGLIADTGGYANRLSGGGTGSGFFALQNPVSKLWIYDSNKVQISSAPMLDIFCDGGPLGVYQNGAIVPPLWYPQNSQIQIDVYSATTTPGQSLQIYCVGKEFFPC